MPQNKHTAIAPDGTVLKRNSKSRTYSHCVAGLVTEESLKRRAEYSLRAATELRDKYQRQLSGEEPLGKYQTTETLVHNAQCAAVDVEKAQSRLDAIAGDEWRALSWVSRPDLIGARIQEFTKHGDKYYAEVIAIPATIA